jgi:hypothetical protein
LDIAASMKLLIKAQLILIPNHARRATIPPTLRRDNGEISVKRRKLATHSH